MAVTEEMTDLWKETTLQTILNNYTKTDIYNADEFGLFYTILSKKTLHLKDDKCTNDKHSKIRLTRLAAANMNDEKLLVCFIWNRKSLDASKLSKNTFCYRGQNKSWIDSALFENWVREIDN